MTDSSSNPLAMAQALHSVLGDRMVAVYQFGSKVAQGSQAAQLRLLIVVDRIDRALLDALAATAASLQQQRVRVRLGTEESLLRGADAFPAFSLELVHCRTLLAGRDVLAKLQVEPAALRLHIEQALRAMHRELVEAYLSPQHQPLVRSLRQATRKLVYLLEGALLAGGLAPPEVDTPEALIAKVRAELTPRANPASWDVIEAFAARGETPEPAAVLQVFDALLDVVGSLIAVVDLMAPCP